MEGNGDIKFIINTVAFATVEDEPRFKRMVDGFISDGLVFNNPQKRRCEQNEKPAAKRKRQ